MPRSTPDDERPERTRQGRRRATTPPPEGSDPEPADREPDRHREGENDDRLRGDKPPHY